MTEWETLTFDVIRIYNFQPKAHDPIVDQVIDQWRADGHGEHGGVWLEYSQSVINNTAQMLIRFDAPLSKTSQVDLLNRLRARFADHIVAHQPQTKFVKMPVCEQHGGPSFDDDPEPTTFLLVPLDSLRVSRPRTAKKPVGDAKPN